MPRQGFWSPKKRTTAVVLHKEGYSYRDIARKLGGGATPAAVWKVCKKFAVTNSVKDKPRCGRKRVSSKRDDRNLIRMAMKNRCLTLIRLARQWTVPTSKHTVRRRLREFGLRARTPRKKPLLNVKQRRQRMEWAKRHRHWTGEEWNKVLWSDESKINLFNNDGVQ